MFERKGEKDRGAVAAEFALILPLIVLLIFGMIQMGIAYQRQEAVNAAAREGARIASLPTSTVAMACNRVTNSLSASTFDTTPSCTVAGDCSGTSESVTVTVSVPNEIDIPFWGTQTVTLTAVGDFRCE